MSSRLRILVLGARGLLGSSLVGHLRESSHDVRTHSRRPGSDVTADLTDPEQAAAALSAVAPDVIINLVALTNVDVCEREPGAAYRVNVKVVENVTSWIASTGSPSHLIQISSDQVYNGRGPHREPDGAPSNYYGFSKYAAELAARTVRGTTLRTNFFGPSECPGRVSLSDWIIGSLRQGKRITVFEDVWFSPLTIRRLCALLTLVSERKPLGVFNLGSRDGMTKADFAFAIADVLGLDSGLLHRGVSTSVQAAAYRPSDMRMDSFKFMKVLDVQLPTLAEEIASLSTSQP